MIHSVLLVAAQNLQSNLGRLSEPKLIELASATHERMARALSPQAKSSAVQSLKPYRLLKSSGEDVYMIDSALGDSVDISPNGVVHSFFHFVSLDPKKPFLPEASLRSSALKFLAAFEPSLSGLEGEFESGMFWNLKDGGWHRFFRPIHRNVPVGPGGIGQVTLEGSTGICNYVTARRMFDVRNLRSSRLTPDEAVSVAMSKTLRSGKSSLVAVNRPPKKWITGNGSQMVYAFEKSNPAVQRLVKLDTGEVTYEVFIEHEDAQINDSTQSRPLSAYLISATDGSVIATLKGGPGGSSVRRSSPTLPATLNEVTLEAKGKKSRRPQMGFSPITNLALGPLKLDETLLLTRKKAYKVRLTKDGAYAVFGTQPYKVSY
ncbi:MAG: hypothetical protein WCK51_01850 [Armatimonadota bacterium]